MIYIGVYWTERASGFYLRHGSNLHSEININYKLKINLLCKCIAYVYTLALELCS